LFHTYCYIILLIIVQKKETGQVFWACRSCMNFAHSITTKVQEVNQKVEVLRGQVKENKEGVAKANEGVKKGEKL
jgi:phage tail tube protein FII